MLRQNYVFSLESMNSILANLNNQRIEIIYYGKEEHNKIDPTESEEFKITVENNLKRLWNKSKEESGRLRAVQDGWQSGKIAGIANEIIGKHIIIKQFYNLIQTAFIAIKTQNFVDDRWTYYIKFTGRFLELWDQKGRVWKPDEYPEELPEALPAAKPMGKPIGNPKQEQKGNDCRESMFTKKKEKAFISFVFANIKTLQEDKKTTLDTPSVLLIDNELNINTFTGDFPGSHPKTWQTYINVYPKNTKLDQLAFNEEFALLSTRKKFTYGLFIALDGNIYDFTELTTVRLFNECISNGRTLPPITAKDVISALSNFKCTFKF